MDFVNKDTFSDVKLYYTEDKFIYGHRILLSSIDYFTRWYDYIAYIYSISYITNKYNCCTKKKLMMLLKN